MKGKNQEWAMAKPFEKKVKTKFTIKETPQGTESASNAKKTQDRLAELEAELNAGKQVSEPAAHSQTPAVPASKSSEKKSLGLPKAVTSGKELFEHHNTGKKMLMFWGVAVLAVVLSQQPILQIFFTPLTQFSTMVHEMGHAVATILTGGTVHSMTIVPDGQGHGGLTNGSGGIAFIISQAGYLGTAIFGCFLVYLSQFPKLSKSFLIAIGVIVGLASIFFMGQGIFSMNFVQALFSVLWGLAMAAGLIYSGWKLKHNYANFVLLFLAIFTAMDSVRSIMNVFYAIIYGVNVTSDATHMEQMFFLPAIFWSLLWGFLSVVMLGTTIWFTYGFGAVKGGKVEKLLSKGANIIKKN